MGAEERAGSSSATALTRSRPAAICGKNLPGWKLLPPAAYWLARALVAAPLI